MEHKLHRAQGHCDKIGVNLRFDAVLCVLGRGVTRELEGEMIISV